MKFVGKLNLLSGTCVVLLGFSQPVLAQQSNPEVAPSDENMGGEILVTARKRPERLLDVPASVTAIGEADLGKQNITNVTELSRSVPGIFVQERGALSTSINIRGVGGDTRNIGLESGVAVVIDGVTAGRTNGYNTGLMEIAQVEVLRGPQGTLFGTNTIGGVLNITTVRPSQDFRAKATVEAGNYDLWRFAGAASGRVTDKFMVGFALQRTTRDGYVYNPLRNERYNGIDQIGGRFQAVWQPTDLTNIYLTADATRDRGAVLLVQPIEPYVGTVSATPDRYTIFTDQQTSGKRDVEGVSLTIDQELGDYTLTAISGLRWVDTNIFSDGDVSSRDLIHSGPFTDESRFAMQELRIVSPKAAPLRFVAGLYYQNEVASSHRLAYLNGAALPSLISDARIRTNSYAAYGNVDLDLVRNLSVNAGVRFNRETKAGQLDQFRRGRPDLTFTFADLRRTDDAASWTGSLRYKLTPDVSTYFTVTRGFKSGGFNVDSISVPAVTAAQLNFRPEKLTNYEVGMKAQLFDRRLTVSVAAFQANYKNRQVSQYVGNQVGVPNIQITNAGSSRTKGVEFEGRLGLLKGMTLSGAFAYFDSVYTDFRNATSAGAVYTGNRTEFTPRYTGNVTLDHTIPVNDTVEFSYTAAAQYQGDTYFDPANNPINFQAGYWLFNVRAGVAFDLPGTTHRASINLWGKNLTKRDYLTLARQSQGVNQGLYGEPRTYGVQFGLTF